jgi:hypothetical protein
LLAQFGEHLLDRFVHQMQSNVFRRKSDGTLQRRDKLVQSSAYLGIGIRPAFLQCGERFDSKSSECPTGGLASVEILIPQFLDQFFNTTLCRARDNLASRFFGASRAQKPQTEANGQEPKITHGLTSIKSENRNGKFEYNAANWRTASAQFLIAPASKGHGLSCSWL